MTDDYNQFEPQAPSLVKLLEHLHEQVTLGLLAELKTGKASPQMYNAAIALLKNNGIEALPTVENSAFTQLLKTVENDDRFSKSRFRQ
jgi:hypothetical protein